MITLIIFTGEKSDNEPIPGGLVLPIGSDDLTPYQDTRDGGAGTPIAYFDNPEMSFRFNWWKAAKGVLNALPFGGVVIAILEAAGVGGGSNRFIDGSTATPEEMATVQDWIMNVWTPFQTNLTSQAFSIINSGSITAGNLPVLNEVLTTLCIVKQYFQVNDNTTFLSDAALDYRYGLVSNICDGIAKQISDKLAASGLNVTLNNVKADAQNYDFAPVITLPVRGLYNCVNYAISQATAQSTPVKTITTLPNASSTTTPVAKNNSTRNAVIMLTVAAAIAALVWPDDSPKKKQE